jgi:hypothetical protein
LYTTALHWIINLRVSRDLRIYQKNISVFDVKLYVQALQHRPTYLVTYNTKDFKNLGNLPVKTPDEIV